MKSLFASADTMTTPFLAKATGEKAGGAPAARYHRDPLCFEGSSNPYGIDSEPELWDAWQTSYDEEFVLNR